MDVNKSWLVSILKRMESSQGFKTQEKRIGVISERGNPLGGEYYYMDMKLDCIQFCCYQCRGTEWIEISESADRSFKQLKPVARIRHEHKCDAFRSDPYHGYFLLEDKEVAGAERIPICGAPLCANDEVRLTISGEQSLGKLLVQGCATLTSNIVGVDNRSQFRVIS